LSLANQQRAYVATGKASLMETMGISVVFRMVSSQILDGEQDVLTVTLQYMARIYQDRCEGKENKRQSAFLKWGFGNEQ
jgi:hypothetical protein